MRFFLSIIWSSIGRKVIMALTGMILISFLVVHLIGNLTLFYSNEFFNLYAHHLESFAFLLVIAEVFLVSVFLVHIITALSLTFDNLNARNVSYKKSANATGPSKKTLSSKTMIYTGSLIAVFVVIHIWMFKFGETELTKIDGKKIRDLYTLVVSAFKSTPVVISYVAAMIILGFHLKHAFWSAFQSLGLFHLRYTPVIYLVGTVFAIVWAFGFLAIPIIFYFK